MEFYYHTLLAFINTRIIRSHTTIKEAHINSKIFNTKIMHTLVLTSITSARKYDYY